MLFEKFVFSRRQPLKHIDLDGIIGTSWSTVSHDVAIQVAIRCPAVGAGASPS
jgi:hypothetical protein